MLNSSLSFWLPLKSVLDLHQENQQAKDQVNCSKNGNSYDNCVMISTAGARHENHSRSNIEDH